MNCKNIKIHSIYLNNYVKKYWYTAASINTILADCSFARISMKKYRKYAEYSEKLDTGGKLHYF